LKTSWAVDLVTVGFSQDGARAAMPKSDFRAGVLSGERWEPPPGGVQILETLEFEMLAVGIRYQNVVNGV